ASVFLTRPFAPVVASAPSIGLAWLVRLRWAAALGQFLLLVFAIGLLDYPVHRVATASLLTIAVVTNLLLMARLRREEPTSEALLAAVLIVDTLLLTGMLLAAGGISNPFSVFYLVHVALASLLVSSRWTWGLAVITTGCFGILFFTQDPHSAHHEHGDFSIHLRGMLLSYIIAAGSIGYFFSQMKRSLAQRDRQLAELGAMRARSEQLVGLSALAAGAAHELGSPLGTIALIAKELERVATTEPVREDAALLRAEVERCRAILATMGDRAGEPQIGAVEPVTTATITEAVKQALGTKRAARVAVNGADTTRVRTQLRPLVQALVNLVTNGLDASSEVVDLDVALEAGDVRFVVTDRGSGMAPETLARIGEPFFTTKPPSRGFGLGLFLVRAFAERSQSRLEVSSTLGAGTRVTLSLAAEP
ncbi:MAG: HAMP domain-containing histidine kinase, partial [Clostridia bacterium]|nr:HAMP domain-containing histidine kinase [Deltaproteobacteria bacterium]